MRIPAGLIFLVFVCAHAQPGCLSVRFQNAVQVNKPSASTHLTVVRQSDGSYTAYEMADASPYGVVRITPDFGGELAACLPEHSVLQALPAPQGSGVSPGATARSQVFARLASGNYLQVESLAAEPNNVSTSTIDIALFSPNMTLLSETTHAVELASPIPLLSLADVNGDGNLDLVALGSASTGLEAQAAFYVFLGNGDGTFQPPVETPVPGTDFLFIDVTAFSVADVNGDGKPDLVLGITGPQGGGSSISLMVGNGDGTFGNPSFILQASFPQAIALADLNGDGKPDLIVTDSAVGLWVALSLGDGSFGSPVIYPNVTGWPAVGDIDGDGFPDIVAGGTILFGDDTGAFPHREDYLCEGVSTLLTDLNSDGRLDIVAGVTGNPLIFSGANYAVTDDYGGTAMSLFFREGSRTYWGSPISFLPALFQNGSEFSVLAEADFNGDGVPDLAFFNYLGVIAVLQGSSAGIFDSVFEYQLPSDLLGSPAAMVTADFNGDGKPDLAAAVQDYPPNSVNHALVFLGNGDGTLQGPIATAVPADLDIASLAAGDFNRDGKMDLAVVVNTQNGGAADEVLIFLGNGDGSFQSPKTYAVGVGASAIVVGDFNGDGKLDLVTANSGTGPLDNGSYSVLPGNGDGTFSAATTIPLPSAVGPSPYSIAAADLNRDGKLDLIITLLDDTAPTNSVAILLGRGDGSFLPPVVYPVTSLGVRVGDLIGDGVPDVVVFPSGSGLDAGGAGYLLGKGDGTLAPEVQLDGLGLLVTAETVDLRRQGKLNLYGYGLGGVVSFLNVSPPRVPIRAQSRRIADR
jgi:hypothetical protein